MVDNGVAIADLSAMRIELHHHDIVHRSALRRLMEGMVEIVGTQPYVDINMLDLNIHELVLVDLLSVRFMDATIEQGDIIDSIIFITYVPVVDLVGVEAISR